MRWSRILATAFVAPALAALLTMPAKAQRRPDPLGALLLRQQLGIPTFGDQLAEVASALANGRRTIAAANAEIAEARREYFRRYGPSGADPAARRRFVELLQGRDCYYLLFAISGPERRPTDSFSTPMDAVTGSFDGGIAPSTRFAYGRWVDGVRSGIGSAITTPSRDLVASLGLFTTLRPALIAADTLYRAYAVHSILEKHAKAGVRPVEWPAEAWRLALLARAA